MCAEGSHYKAPQADCTCKQKLDLIQVSLWFCVWCQIWSSQQQVSRTLKSLCLDFEFGHNLFVKALLRKPSCLLHPIWHPMTLRESQLGFNCPRKGTYLCLRWRLVGPVTSANWKRISNWIIDKICSCATDEVTQKRIYYEKNAQLNKLKASAYIWVVEEGKCNCKLFAKSPKSEAIDYIAAFSTLSKGALWRFTTSLGISV